jgi:phosphoglycolate phosphatase
MLRTTSRDELPIDTITGYVGHGAPRLIASVLGPRSTEADRKSALAIFLAHYADHCLGATRAYPGVAEGLAALAGLGISSAVLTNKPLEVSLQILQGLDLAKLFKCIYGGDSFETKKPDPTGALAILRELGADPGDAAMVGDSDVDVQTARNAGMRAVAVTYGFGNYDRTSNPADLYLDSLAGLITSSSAKHQGIHPS